MAPLPEGTLARMEAVLREGEQKTDLLREAVEEHLRQREGRGPKSASAALSAAAWKLIGEVNALVEKADAARAAGNTKLAAAKMMEANILRRAAVMVDPKGAEAAMKIVAP